MNILPDIQEKINSQIMPLVPSKWKPMFSLGVNAFSFNVFQSLNSNARMARNNSKASQKQMWRLTQHKKILRVFSSILVNRFTIDEKSTINIDFSTFYPYQILCFSLQTSEGRSIPVWFDVIEYPVERDSQNIFILDVLREFLAVVGCTPKIVCDRGFIGKNLVGGFIDLGLTFYVRMKSGKSWSVDGKKRVLSKQWKLDETGVMYGEKMRVVRSSRTLAKKLKAKEAWYIITNDFTSDRDKILRTYYYRFEIEEVFKDLKSLLKVKPRWFKTESSIKVLLWFQILGLWMFWKISKLRNLYISRTTCHKKKRLSWVKQIFEQLTKERVKPIISCNPTIATTPML